MKKLYLLIFALLFAGCTTRSALPTATPAPTAAPIVSATAAPAPAETPEVTETPAPTENPAEESAAPIGVGSYRFTAPDGSVWVLSLKDKGCFSLIAPDHTYSGEGWCDNGDSSVTTGPTEAREAFLDEFGAGLWRIRGEEAFSLR